jgi:hypothetical protein
MFYVPLLAPYVFYFVAFFVFHLFFNGGIKFSSRISIRSYFYSFVATTIAYFFIFTFLEPFDGFGNRVLHAVGGGSLAFFSCFLVARDGDFKINKFQFFFFSFLLVAFLGVLNEIFEFVGQHYFHILMTPSVEDTWLDLISNTWGTLLASVILVPFFKVKKL